MTLESNIWGVPKAPAAKGMAIGALIVDLLLLRGIGSILLWWFERVDAINRDEKPRMDPLIFGVVHLLIHLAWYILAFLATPVTWPILFPFFFLPIDSICRTWVFLWDCFAIVASTGGEKAPKKEKAEEPAAE